MIISLLQANAVQTRRVAQNKCGYAKAVRRFMLREHSHQYKNKLLKLPRLVPKKHLKN